MPIPANYSNRFIYHFTHIENLPGLLETGLLANGHQDFPEHVQSVAEAGIQARRSQMGVTCGPQGVVHDYVPFYFGAKSLMLLGVIHKKNIDQCDILYFEFPIALLDQDGAVFTDASANTALAPNFYSDPQELGELNWAEIDSQRWSCASDQLRHQRMAEALVHGQVPLSAASACVVWNKRSKTQVQKITDGVEDFPNIQFENSNRRHYFTKFLVKEEKGQSLVKGPNALASMYVKVCEHFDEHIGENSDDAPFTGPKSLLAGLRKDFGCIPETAELVGLETVNRIHKETVDIHTQQVVDTLLAQPEFEALDVRQKTLIELAAFLHDIGKGPKKRWLNNETGVCLQQNDPDHPFTGMIMLARVLTEEIVSIKPKNAKLLAKLVCYHDLVGDVLGRGRHESQIIQIADSAEELRLLFLLGKADATTLGFHWDQAKADALFARTLTAIEAK
ncbi:MAG: DarT ssDNA thymidine ADP-ribosyltransferase family protein [Roseobacter sp.]